MCYLIYSKLLVNLINDMYNESTFVVSIARHLFDALSILTWIFLNLLSCLRKNIYLYMYIKHDIHVHVDVDNHNHIKNLFQTKKNIYF